MADTGWIAASYGFDVGGATKFPNDGSDWCGYDGLDFFRVVNKFDITSLPSGATVTQIDVRINVATTDGDVSSTAWMIGPYHGNGYASDPQTDSASDSATYCDVSLDNYVFGNTDYRTTGLKTELALGTTANTDMENARSSGTDFSLAWMTEYESDSTRHTEFDEYTDGTNPPSIRITYIVGSTITGGGTPQAETATTIASGTVGIDTGSNVQATTATASGAGIRIITGSGSRRAWFSPPWFTSAWFSADWFIDAPTASPASTSNSISTGVRTGTATTQATTATIVGVGVRIITGSAIAQATTAIANGPGVIIIYGVGVAVASPATTNTSASSFRIRPMAQYLNIVNEILDELNEVRLTAANFSEAKNIQRFVKDAVNRAYLDIHDLEYKWPWTTFSSPQDNQLGNTYIETEAGTRWYLLKSDAIDVDSDYGHIDWENFVLTEEGVSGKSAPYEVNNLCHLSVEDWRNRYAVTEERDKNDSSSYEKPRRVLRSPDGRRFGLSPIPDEIYRIYFTAYNQITILSDYDDEIVMPSQYLPVLTSRIRYYAWQFKQEPNQAVLAKQDFDRGLKQMRRALNPVDLKLIDDRMRVA